MVEKRTLHGFITFIACLIVMLIADHYICNTYFCDTCEFDERNMIYKYFYRNESDTGYYAEPTLINYIMVVLVSAAAGRIVAKK